MKQLSLLTKIMFCIVAILLVVTVVLGIMTAVKDSKENKDKNQTITSTTLTPSPTPSSANGTPSATPSAVPTETPTPVPTEAPVATGGHKIAIDPGQQKSQMTEEEPVGPGASATTAKMSYGATSTTTGKREYEWSLLFAKRLEAELIARGYEVVLTREDHDVKISNAERAQFVNASGAEMYLSIQADAASNLDAKGIYTQIPSKNNAFVGNLYNDCRRLAKEIQNNLIAETGTKDRGVQENDKVPAINYSEVPVAVLQLGFMSNVEEDTNLWSESYQDKMIKAICDGIDTYFREQ
ncbi:MAG: N-acetylmuramoyl-L-alanine amidase [Lachnospiraceae bacterium]|nr:N-acetylmuramoyl-L-alanine amidase [Lachnospiraceae bacterium]MBQ8632031.1 N-acetylmuramoyl-L-alanine amidase [Lachnospiraceae bacterium]